MIWALLVKLTLELFAVIAAGSESAGLNCLEKLDEEVFRRREAGRDDVALSANEVVTLVLARRGIRPEEADLQAPVPVVFCERIDPPSESTKLTRRADFPSATLPALPCRSERVIECPRVRCALHSVVTSNPVNAFISLLTSPSTLSISCRISAALERCSSSNTSYI